MINKIKIVITGPESTGKSTLTKQLSEYYNADCVAELAREFIEKLGRKYAFDDVCEIAKLQINAELNTPNQDGEIVFYDTDLIVTKIWFKRVFDKVPDWIDTHLQNHPAYLHLLCYPDLPWVYDPVRENPDNRLELFDEYESEIKQLEIQYHIITGVGEERFRNAVKSIESFLALK
ncbi:MAG: ATP-binding protein [Bacteroidales bacterium]|nr:ATP-binding protein [Bacteroidales bacterium]